MDLGEHDIRQWPPAEGWNVYPGSGPANIEKTVLRGISGRLAGFSKQGRHGEHRENQLTAKDAKAAKEWVAFAAFASFAVPAVAVVATLGGASSVLPSTHRPGIP